MPHREIVVSVEYGAGYTLRYLRNGSATITCTACGAVSSDPADIRYLYCARCRVFHNDGRLIPCL